jgi:hypothetical protein
VKLFLAAALVFCSRLEVSALDVYVAVTYTVPGPAGQITKPAYLKNATSVVVQDFPPAGGKEYEQGTATSLTVAGGSVFVGGAVETFTMGKGFARRAAYWKDSVPTILGRKEVNSVVTAVAVAAEHVYCVGYVDDSADGSRCTAVIWTDGVQKSLSRTGWHSRALAIAIEGGDVYVAGFEGDPSSAMARAVYWKNGARVALTDGTAWSIATSISTDRGDVYSAVVTAGGSATESRRATYYRNGRPVTVEGTRGL